MSLPAEAAQSAVKPGEQVVVGTRAVPAVAPRLRPGLLLTSQPPAASPQTCFWLLSTAHRQSPLMLLCCAGCGRRRRRSRSSRRRGAASTHSSCWTGRWTWSAPAARSSRTRASSTRCLASSTAPYSWIQVSIAPRLPLPMSAQSCLCRPRFLAPKQLLSLPKPLP